MNYSSWTFAASLGVTMPLLVSGRASAQTATVTLSSQKQYIRGFGGMSHAAWAGDLTAAERTLAFGNADGQLGFSALRIPVTDGAPDSVNVATAKAAIAAGAIVFATPWNAAGAMNSSQFSTYAGHLNGFVTYMKNQGVDLYAIGTQNEPDYGAQAGWGSWTAAQCHDFLLNYASTITTKLMSCESFSYAKSYYDPILNDSAALAKATIFGTHLYGTPVSSYAYPLFDSNGTGKERWMTEHYTDSTTSADSWPNALGVASELHNAMVTGQFNLYTWWYIKRSYGFIYNGAVTKRGACIGHWSKFVRPGFYRVDATASPTAGVSLSAYKSDTGVVIIAVNTNTSSKTLTVTVDGSNITSYTKFTTSSSKTLTNDGKLTASNGSLSLSLDASSVTTLQGTGPSTAGGGSGGSGAGGSASSGGAAGFGGSANDHGGVGGVAGVSGGTAGSDSAAGSDSVAGTSGGAGYSSVGGAGQGADHGGSLGGGALSAGATSVGGSAGAVGAVGGGIPDTGGGAAIDGSPSDQSGCTCQAAGASALNWTQMSPLLLALVGLGRRRRGPKRKSH